MSKNAELQQAAQAHQKAADAWQSLYDRETHVPTNPDVYVENWMLTDVAQRSYSCVAVEDVRAKVNAQGSATSAEIAQAHEQAVAELAAIDESDSDWNAF